MCKPTSLSKENTTNIPLVPTDASTDAQGQVLVKAKENLANGTFFASMSLITLISAFSLLMPFMQTRRDDLQCDTLCQGSMTSARSALSLIGSALMGRLSDKKEIQLGGFVFNGRMVCLYIGTFATLIGFVISGSMYSITGMWLGMIPGALLQQNFNVYKALLADYHEAISQLEIRNRNVKEGESKQGDVRSGTADDTNAAAARAGSVGKLGMSVGLSFMIGPLLGTTFVKTYQSAILLSSLLTVLSGFWIVKMPLPSSATATTAEHDLNDTNGEEIHVGAYDNDKKKGKKEFSFKNSFMSMIDVKSAKTKPAMFLMTIRLSMALAFHIFNLIWTVSLKRRFNFGPSDHGKFMSYIGLVFALSQGFLAKRILAPFSTNKGRINVILACCLALGVGRFIAFQVNDLRIVYVMFGFIVMSLGVVNTVLTADTCLIAPSSEIGGVYGVLEAAQSAAGMIGPFIGGLLAKIHPVNAPLGAVVGLYAFVFVLVSFGYEKFILNQGSTIRKKNKAI